jgi:potassium efflux system protein
MRRALLWFLVLASVAVAQGDQLADAKKLLAAAEKKLKELGEPEKGEEKRWVEAVKKRKELLGEYIETRKQAAQVPTDESIAKRKRETESQLKRIRAEPEPKKAGLTSLDQMPEFESRQAAADKEQTRAKSEYDAAARTSKEQDKERSELAVRLANAKKQATAASDEDFDKYRAKTGEIAITVCNARDAYLTSMRAAWVALTPVLRAELDFAEARAKRADTLLKLARVEAAALRKKLEEDRKSEADRIQDQLDAATETKDKLRLGLLLQTAQARAELQRLQNRLGAVKTEVAQEEEAVKRVEDERTRLKHRLELRAGSAAKMLKGSLDKLATKQQILERSTKPRLRREMASNSEDLVAILDRIWELQRADEEESSLAEVYQEFLTVAEKDQGPIREAYTELLRALREQRTALERIETNYGQLSGLVRRREQALHELRAFVVRQIYWIKNEPAINREVLAATGREIADLLRKRREAVLWSSVVLGLAVLLLLAPQLRRLRIRLRGAGKAPVGLRGKLRQTAVAFVIAIVPAAVLVGIGVVLRVQTLPRYLTGIPDLLNTLAVIVFAQRLAEGYLGPNGVAVRAWGLHADVSRQLARYVALLAVAAVVGYVPGELLTNTPFDTKHLQRFFEHFWKISVILAHLLLLRRKGAVMQHWTKPDGFVRKAWRVIGPLTTLAMIGIIAMDLVGYRIGAGYLFRNVLKTLVAFLILVAIYNVLVGAARRVAGRIRREATERGEGVAEAWESSAAVTDQLTRLIAIVVSVVAAVALMAFWRVDETLLVALKSVEIVEVDAATQTMLTLFDVVLALLWIVGGHLVVHHLGGLYEHVIFPFVGGTDQGGRFVAVALSRYVIIVLVYGAALVTLHISFSSIGWILTAASVGIGFGLQEIIANFISGLILLIERPVRVGDIIEVGQTSGTVEKIQIRATTVTNWDKQTIIVPNKNFITQNLTNWTRMNDIMRRTFKVSVKYGTDIGRVLKDPPHRIWVGEFAPSGIEFDVWIYTHVDFGFSTRSALRQAVYERLQAEGIEIPLPQLDMHVKDARETEQFLPPSAG